MEQNSAWEVFIQEVYSLALNLCIKADSKVQHSETVLQNLSMGIAMVVTAETAAE